MISPLVQQHLFSYFNLTKACSVKSLLDVLEEITTVLGLDGSPTTKQLEEEILQINKKIQKLDLEIVETVDEITCEKLFVLINTADNIITQKSKFYDESTSQLFSKIVTNCVLSEEGHVSETDCLNLTSQIKMTKYSAQSVLEKLIADKWLLSKDNKISLGMRSIVELEQYIKQHYPDDIKNCPFCKLIVVQGYACENCKIKCHFACRNKYFGISKSNCACPGCKEVWKDVPLGVNTDASQESEGAICDTGPSKKKKKKSSA